MTHFCPLPPRPSSEYPPGMDLLQAGLYLLIQNGGHVSDGESHENVLEVQRELEKVVREYVEPEAEVDDVGEGRVCHGVGGQVLVVEQAGG